jgi:hypothetical protein
VVQWFRNTGLYECSSRHLALEGLRKTINNLSSDDPCPDRDSKRISPEWLFGTLISERHDLLLLLLLLLLALQPFFGPWRLFQFLTPIRSL